MKIYMGRYPDHIKHPDKERKIEIRVDGYDVWSADHTLAMIIAPVLKKLQEAKHGAPFVDDEDVPENLRDYIPKDTYGETGPHHFEKWEWVLAEMIWAFEQHTQEWEDQFYSGESDYQFLESTDIDHPDGPITTMVHGPNHTRTCDYEGMNAWSERMKNGRMLFAKYFSALWD